MFMVAFFLFSSVKLYVLCEMDGRLVVFFLMQAVSAVVGEGGGRTAQSAICLMSLSEMSPATLMMLSSFSS